MTIVRLTLTILLAITLSSAGCGPSASAPPPDDPVATVVTLPAAAPTAAPTAAPSSAPAAKAEGAASYTFDGFKLGTLFGSAVMSRAPYDQPCDNDPIDNKARRFMVYGAKPCRERTFPENTTVLFYIKFTDAGDKYDQPIEAFAWMGGDYFATRSNFPVRTGKPASTAAEILGAPVKTFQIERKTSATVHRHPGDVWSIVEDGVLVGFVVGPMPEDPESEQWRGLMQMYERYTRAR